MADEIIGRPMVDSDLKSRVAARLRKASPGTPSGRKQHGVSQSYLNRDGKNRLRSDSGHRRSAVKSSLFSALDDVDDMDDLESQNSFGSLDSDDDKSIGSTGKKKKRLGLKLKHRRNLSMGPASKALLRGRKVGLLDSSSSHARIEDPEIGGGPPSDSLLMMSEEREKRLMQKNKAALDENKKPRRKSLSLARRGSEHEGSASPPPPPPASRTPPRPEQGSSTTPGRKVRKSLSMGFGAGSDKKSESEPGSTSPGRKVRRSLSMGFRTGSNKKNEPQQGSTSPSRKARKSMSMSFSAGNTAAEPSEQKDEWSAPKPTARHKRSSSMGLFGAGSTAAEPSEQKEEWSVPRPTTSHKRSSSMGLFATNSVPPPPEALRDHQGDSSNSLDQDLACLDVDHDVAYDSKNGGNNEGWLSYGMSIALKPFEQLYDDCTEAKNTAADEEEEPDDHDYDDEDLPVVYHDETSAVTIVDKLRFVAAVAVNVKSKKLGRV